jgi:phosphoglycolate phosphatase-like HAD superfamily hydrolase
MEKPLFIYVDVDDTLVCKKSGSEGAPIPHVVQHVSKLHSQGAQLYCWSTGGEEHARAAAQKLGIEQCFTGFLHKPQVFIDDERADEWPHFVHVSPDALGSMREYRDSVAEKHEQKSSDV